MAIKLQSQFSFLLLGDGSSTVIVVDLTRYPVQQNISAGLLPTSVSGTMQDTNTSMSISGVTYALSGVYLTITFPSATTTHVYSCALSLNF